MNSHTLKLLEWDQILEKLSSHAVSLGGKEYCRKISFLNGNERVQKGLASTTEAKEIYALKGNLPFSARPQLKALFPLMEKGKVLAPEELILAADWIGDFIALRRYFSDLPQPQFFPNILDLAKSFNDLTPVQKAILQAIEPGGNIKDSASSALYAIRQEIKTSQNRILEKLNQLMAAPTSSGAFQEHLVTLRNDRYVIPVKAQSRGLIAGVVHDTSSSGSTLYMEPMIVLEMNNQLQELKGREKEEIARILAELTRRVLDQEKEFLMNIALLEEIDFTFAKGGLSIELDGSPPRILPQKARAEIIGARHPLLAGSVIPIDIRIGTEFTTLVITGPNTGGKTVALKTLGLCLLMAQAGLHPPLVPGSAMGLFDKILCDIGDEQSLSQSLSTFSGHMKNIVAILNEADSNSLVLLDEIGAGTDPAEGSALGQAIIEAFHRKGCKMVVTTHYDSLKHLATQIPGIQNGSVEFDEETLSPTYRLLIGVPGYSNALHIARRLGLADPMIQRAQELLGTERVNLTRQREELEQLQKSLKRSNEELLQEKEALGKVQGELEKQKQAWQETRNKLYAQTRQELEKELETAKELVNETIRSLQREKSLAKAQEAKESLEIISQVGSHFKPQAPDLQKKLPELKVGEEYYLPHLEQRGKLLTLPDSDGEVQVLIGMIKTTVKSSQLVREAGPKPSFTPSRPFIKSSVMVPSRTVSIQLDLRGLLVEEALRKLEAYLDDVARSSLPSVSIIHGKGTGALQKAVHQYLSNSPYVKEFRFGAMGEGDYGVTIVTLK